MSQLITVPTFTFQQEAIGDDNFERPTQTEQDSEMCQFAQWINECVMGYENEKGFYWNIHESPDEITHKHISTTDLLTAFRAQKQRYALDH
jgi:hypothetical protein